MKNKTLNQNGFTLIELLIAMVLGSVVTIAVYGVFSDQQKHYKIQELVTGMQQNARAAMDRMTQEIRMANCCTTLANYFSGLEGQITVGTGQINGISRLDPTWITFTTNVVTYTGGNSDGGTNQEVSYFFCDQARVTNNNCSTVDSIYRTSGTSTEIAAENIQNLSFFYGLDLNEDNEIDTWRDSYSAGNADKVLRTVRIILTSQTGESLPPPINQIRTFDIVSEVTPRNTLGNL